MACLQVRTYDAAAHFGSSVFRLDSDVTVGGESGVMDTSFRVTNSVLRFFLIFEHILGNSYVEKPFGSGIGPCSFLSRDMMVTASSR